jgi:hypothetical protein
MEYTLLRLKSLGCRVILSSSYSYSSDTEWSCQIQWANPSHSSDRVELTRDAHTPSLALEAAETAFMRLADRGLPLSQLVDHTS